MRNGARFRRLWGGSGASYVAEASALFAAMATQPDATRKGHINTLIVALQAGGVWSLCDCIWGLAAHAQADSLINWKAPGTYNLTVTGSPTFATDQGWTGTGAAANRLDSTFNPTTAGSPNYVQNSAHVSVWTRTAGTQSDTHQTIGQNSGAFIVTNGASTPGFVRYRVNHASASSTAAGYDGLGHYLARRTASNAVAIFRNASSIGTASNASTAVVNAVFSVCANAGTAGSAQCSFATVGAALDNSQVSAAYSAIQTYLQAIGAV